MCLFDVNHLNDQFSKSSEHVTQINSKTVFYILLETLIW
jgi:hypothetical protein